jgi:NAD(P)H-dependent FMN reductase
MDITSGMNRMCKRLGIVVGRKVLLISGSLRAMSTNTALLATAAKDPPPWCECTLYEGLSELVAFNPDLEAMLPPSAKDLRAQIHQADAIVFSTPEYAGALPGALKNLLDWTIGDDHPHSVYDKPVAWLIASPRGAHGAHEELRRVLSYAHASVVESACAFIPVSMSMIGRDGTIEDPGVKQSVARSLQALMGEPLSR